MRPSCPICHAETCPPMGHADLLIVGEFPGQEEMKQHRPFASNPNFMTAGKILRIELSRVGLDLMNFRTLNLWQHEPNKSEECFKVGYDTVLDEAKGKSAILLVGSEVVETFTEYKVSDVSGLQVDSAVLSCPILYAMVNPSYATHRSLGEVRHGIEKFVKRLQKEKLV